MSADGQFVVFSSSASDLVNNDTNDFEDVFVRDLQEGATTRVNVSSAGVQADGWSFGYSISHDGRFVCFSSEASNLVSGDTNGVGDMFVRDRQNQRTTRVSVGSSGEQAESESWACGLSGDGRFVAFVVADSFNHSGGVPQLYLRYLDWDE